MRAFVVAASLALCSAALAPLLRVQGDPAPHAVAAPRAAPKLLADGVHFQTSAGDAHVDVRIDTIERRPHRLGLFRLRSIATLELGGVAVRIARDGDGAEGEPAQAAMGARAAVRECLARVPAQGVTGVDAEAFRYERTEGSRSVLRITAARARFDPGTDAIALDGGVAIATEDASFQFASARLLEDQALLLPGGGAPVALPPLR